jgi:hypothetical protein
MVLPGRSGASHGCDCILCAVPALSGWRLRCFSRQLAREDTALRPHCGVTRDRGWSDSQAEARDWTHSIAYDGQQHSSVSVVPLLVTTRPGSPLMAMGHLALETTCEDASDVAQSFSDLPTAKADAREVQANRRSKWYAGT